MQQEKAKESYKTKTDLSVFGLAAKLRKQINPFFIYSPPSKKFLTRDCLAGAAETAAPPKEGSS